MGLTEKAAIGVVVVLLVCSCGGRQVKSPPDLTLEYGRGLDTPGLETYIALVKPGGASWAYSSITGPVHFIADAIHPLDGRNNYLEISGTNKVKIKTAYPPDYFAAVYWPLKCIGYPETHAFDFEKADVVGNAIVLPSGEPGYVFLVKAVWESVNGLDGIEAYADYVFLVKSD